MKKLNLLPIMATALVVFFTGCKKDDFEPEEFLCPEVVSTIPADNAIDVPLNQIISATFNEKMDSATINQESFTIQQSKTSITESVPYSGLTATINGKKKPVTIKQESATTQQNGTSITGTVTYSGQTATFSPSGTLLPDRLYSATITTQASNLIGRGLMEDYHWSFTTISEVTLASNPPEGGTTSGAGTFKKDSVIHVVAHPNDGYSFVNWTLNGTPVSNNPDYQFAMDGNKDLVANFTLKNVVRLSSNPPEGGKTTGGGAYDLNEIVTVSASANLGYEFLNWTEGANVVSQNAYYTFAVTGNHDLVANFTENSAAEFIVDLSSNPVEGGNTFGGGAFELDASVTVSASANNGYTFSNWTEGANVVSQNANYTFTITGDRNLVANFIENSAEQFTVDVISSPAEGGTTTGGGTFDSGASVTVSATANTGYTFSNWMEGTNVVSQNANYTFEITEDRDLVANFIENGAEQFTVDLSSSPAEGGTTTGGGTFDSGASVTVSATANAGYTFSNWTEGTNIVSQNANYTFALTGNRSLVANFIENGAEQFTVDLSSSPAEGGTTTGGGTFDSGASVTVSATANAGYTFSNWTEDGNIVSENANYTFALTGNRSLVANFTENGTEQFTVELSSNPAEGGTTTGGGTFDSGASVTVSANANEGYEFSNWTEDGNIVSENIDYTFTITGNRVLVANFTEDVPIGPEPIDLGGADSFSILTKSGISTTGVTSIQGDIGVSPATSTAITGFDLIMNTDGQSSHTTIPTLVTGSVYAADYAPPTPTMLTTAVADMETAYTTANNLVVPAPIIDIGAGNISGLTLAPGLYKWSTGVSIDPGATVILSGSENDTWVFQVAQDLTLMSGAHVILQGGAQASNITWVVAGQGVLGTGTVLYGNILSKTLISLNTGATVTGRLLAQTAVTLNTSTVVEP